MKEIAELVLDNELDLILVHQKMTKLAELAGLTLVGQTAFATAVSEVVQDAIAHAGSVTLAVGISEEQGRDLVARIQFKNQPLTDMSQEGIQYIRQSGTSVERSETPCGSEITLCLQLPANPAVSDVPPEDWETHLNQQPAVSPGDQIRAQHRQLQAMAERLRESENQYHTLTNSLPLMIFTATSQGKLLYANKWLQEYTGTTLEALNDRGWKSVVHADDAYRDWHWRKQLPQQTNFQNEIRIRDAATGDYIWHLINATAALNEQNEVISWNGFLVNIHAQKMMDRTLKDNQELTETKEQLQQYQLELQMNIGELNRSNQELAEFAYVASHDLQEPLRKIQSFGTLLLEQVSAELSPSARDMIHRMHSAAERMHVLIKDLLSYSRLNTHQQSFRPVDLNDLIGEVMVDLEFNIRERNAQIDFQPLPTIKGDSLQLRQMLQNLLSNALKFRSPDRPPRIKVNAEKVTIFDIPVPMRNREPSYLAISVEDNGIGFDERYHDRIFQLFQRLHSRDQYAGTGIGLTICKKVAEMHGGTIAAQSTPGQGARFTVYLPASILIKKIAVSD